jgi:hypothetical protein
MQWDRDGEISRPLRIVPISDKRPVDFEWLERTLIASLLAVIGFLGAYTLNGISSDTKQMRQDISSLQVDVAKIAGHIHDEYDPK